MSEKDGPSESSESKKEESQKEVNNQPEESASGSGIRHYATDPIQFRVRGTTITGASPPKFVSFEEIMKAAHGFKNMALAHEIAVDQDFKLEPFEPPDNSYQKMVKETMHKAYFDILREQLNADPPEYKQALVLLEDVKQGLFSITLPRHTRIRQMIEEVLDQDFIRQQAVNSSLDFNKYATFVIDLMTKLAAPARDEMIQDISKLTDTVEIFRSILEALEVLKLDLANTLIALLRPHVQAHTANYERDKFQQMLDVQEGLSNIRSPGHLEALEVLKLDLANTLIALLRPHVQAHSANYERDKFQQMLDVQEDGLQYTREWLTAHIDKEGLDMPVTDQVVVRNVTAQSLAKAYLELLEWDEKKPYPETMTLDAPRFAELGIQVYRLIAVASILLVSPSCSQTDQSSAAELKKQLKSTIYIIIDDASTDTQLKAVLPSVAEEIIQSTEQFLERFNQGPLTADVKDVIRAQIVNLRDPEHKVRVIVRQRVLEFLKDTLVCGGGSKQVPVGLSALSHELTSIAGTLLRYVMHNKAVFTKYYMDIVEAALKSS